MNVAMQHDEELLFTWDSGFGNERLSVTEQAVAQAAEERVAVGLVDFEAESEHDILAAAPDGGAGAGISLVAACDITVQQHVFPGHEHVVENDNGIHLLEA